MGSLLLIVARGMFMLAPISERNVISTICKGVKPRILKE